jgi:glycosyltransferase involved in cell wall biosynthesis
MALKPMCKIVCTSDATKVRLERLGMSSHQLISIPWSVSRNCFSNEATNGYDIRKKYNVQVGDRIVLWSGPLQDTGHREFAHALSVARNVCKVNDRYTFIFAFKPGKKFIDYSKISVGDAKIKIVETSREELLDLRSITSFFLSPICNKNRTVAPPLTWIEMMGSGVPIITSVVDGVDEIIIHQDSGFVVDKVEETVDLLLRLEDAALFQVGQNAMERVRNDFSIEEICARYVDLWKTILDTKRARSAGA